MVVGCIMLPHAAHAARAAHAHATCMPLWAFEVDFFQASTDY